MNIKYLVCLCEASCGKMSTGKERRFNTVEEAIEFKEAQTDGHFSWWDIFVEYEKEEVIEEPLKCEDCGSTSDSVFETYCPYTQDICGEDVECVVCGDCYNTRVQDI